LKGSIKKLMKIGSFTVTFVVFFIYLLPLLWAVMSSIKDSSLIIAIPPVFLFKPTFSHYLRLHTEWIFYGKMWNSFVVSSITAIICVVVGLPAAFVLARYRLGKDWLSIWILSNRFLPIVAILLPLFLMFRTWRLLDTYIVLILVYLIPNLPFSIWLLRGFISDIPIDLDAAARVDGCGSIGVLFRIILPLTSSAIAVVAIFVFLFSWNEFFIPLVLTNRNVVPVSVSFAGFKMKEWYDWGAMTAGAVVCLIPLFLMVMVLGQRIVRGMTLGAVKE